MIYIIHGAFGNPQENWIPWLKQNLQSEKVIVPKFPTLEGQTLENWLKIFEKYLQLNKKDILIGHSLGATFILNILQKINTKIKAAFFISAVPGKLGQPKFDKINKSFLKDFDWKKINKNCDHFTIIHADNDPYVPLSLVKKLAKNLETELIVVKNSGHLNKAAGYTKFLLLLEKINKVV